MTELILAGDEQQNVPAVLEIAHGLGYTATTPTPGRIKLERGSVGMTIAFGGLAGKKFHISFTFDIGVDEHRNTWLRFDQDGAKAEETRRRIYDMVVAEKLPMQGFHYPFPSLGHVEKDGTGYRVVPVMWNPTL